MPASDPLSEEAFEFQVNKCNNRIDYCTLQVVPNIHSNSIGKIYVKNVFV